MQELEGYITAVVTATGMGGDEVGTFLRSSMSRIFRLGSEGEEDAGKSEEFLNSIGIAVRNTTGEFRPFNEIISETAIKYKELNNIQQIALAQQLSGTMHYPKMIALLENFNIAQKATAAAYNSQNSAMVENAKYLDSISGRAQIFKTTLEGIFSSVISSDFLKNLITSGTEFLSMISRIVSQFGGWNVAFLGITIAAIAFSKSLIGINTQLATTGALSFGNAIKMLIPAFFGLTTATAGLNTQLITMNLLTAGIPLLIGAVTIGLMAYGNEQQKLKEQTEAINIAQTNFNATLKDFNNTLDVTKIEAAAKALEELKKATNYDKNIEQISKLKSEIAELAISSSVNSNYASAYGIDITDKKKQQLLELEKSIEQVNAKEKLYNESKQLAISLDYTSIQANSRNIASKLQEINTNTKLIDSYKSVYEKLKNSQELTKEETALNDKLIQQYPEYTRLLGDKSKKLGVNFEALNSNMKAQQALATIELNTLKATAELESINTQNIIDNTTTRVLAIETEIKALEARNEMYLSTINPDDENSFKAESFYFRNAKRITDSSKMLAEAKNQLDKLNSTKGAWDTLKGLSAEDLLNPKSNGMFSPTSDDGKSPIPYESETDALIKSFNAEVDNDKIKSKILETQLKQAESAKDYNKQLTITNELLENQQKTITDLQDANSKIQNEANNVRSGSGYDTTSWFDVNGEATYAYKQLLNTFAGSTDDASKATKKTIEDTFDSLYKLKQGWIANTNAIDTYKEAIQSTSLKLKDMATTYAQTLIETERKSKELAVEAKNKSDLANLESDIYGMVGKEAYETAAQNRIDALEKQADILKEQEERTKRILDINKAQEALDNAKNERNTRIYRAEANGGKGGFVFEANPKAVREAQEKLSDLKVDYASWEYDNDIKRQKQLIEDLVKAKSLKYSEGETALTTTLQNEKNAIDVFYFDIEDLVGKKLDGINELQGEKLAAFITELGIQAGVAESLYAKLYANSKSPIITPSADSLVSKGFSDLTSGALKNTKIGDILKNINLTNLIPSIPKINFPTLNPAMAGVGAGTIYNINIDKVETPNADDLMSQLRNRVKTR